MTAAPYRWLEGTLVNSQEPSMGVEAASLCTKSCSQVSPSLGSPDTEMLEAGKGREPWKTPDACRRGTFQGTRCPRRPWETTGRATSSPPPPQRCQEIFASERERQLGFQVGLAAFPWAVCMCVCVNSTPGFARWKHSWSYRWERKTGLPATYLLFS